MLAGLTALIDAIERRLEGRSHNRPPEAYLLGAQRGILIAALQQRLLGSVSAIHWPTFHRVGRILCDQGLDGLRAAVALSLPGALHSGARAEVMATVQDGLGARPQSVVFGRLTRPTCGHVLFRSQVLILGEREFGTTPLELAALLAHHTPAALRAMLQARLIRSRPDLDGAARRALVFHTARHLGRLLPEADAARVTALLLRLAYYRLHHPVIARDVLRRLRVVDFRARRAVGWRRVQPGG